MLLEKEELKQINGGAVSGVLISSIIKGVTVFLDLGRAVGSGIRRIGSGNVCPL